MLYYLSKERALLGGQRLGHGSFLNYGDYGGLPEMVGSGRLCGGGGSRTGGGQIQELNDRPTSSVNTSSMFPLGPTYSNSSAVMML